METTPPHSQQTPLSATSLLLVWQVRSNQSTMLSVGAGKLEGKTWRVKGIEKVPKQIIFWMDGQDSIFPLLKNAQTYQFGGKR